MSNKTSQDITEVYKSLIETQWDKIEPPAINLSALRKFLIERIPFYAHALQLIDIVFIDDRKDLPSFGFTNGYKVYISPKLFTITGMAATQVGKPWFKSIEQGIGFTILHEIGHIVFNSFDRLQHRSPELWNIATDYQINQFVSRIMKESQVFRTESSYTSFMEVLNKNFLLDPAKYSQLSAEGTYDDLLKLKVSCAGGEGGGAALGAGNSLGGDMDYKENKDANGKPLSAEDQMARDIVKSEMKDYASKNASKLPGSGTFGREFEYLMEPPKVNLRQVLRLITDRTNTEDWAYNSRGSKFDHLMPPNTRLPSITDSNPDKIRRVFMVIDSSGSMSSEQLNDAINIIREIEMKYTKNPIHLIIHTDQVVFSEALKSYKETPRNYSGGTAFQPVLDEIQRLKKEEHIIPSVVCWITDLYGELGPGDYNPRNFPFHKVLRWIISGSDMEPTIGKYYHIDEV